MIFNKLSLKFGNERSSKVIVNIIGSMFIKGGSILVSLVLVPLTLSYLTQYEYGVWLTLSSLIHWLDYFDIGLANGLRNKLAECIANKDYNKGRSYISTAYFLLTVIAIISSLIFLIINHVVDWNNVLNTVDNPINNLSVIILIVFISTAIQFVMKTVSTIYTANQDPMYGGLFSLLGQILSMVIILILTKTTAGNFLYIALAFSVSPIVIYFLSYPIAFHSKYKDLRPSINLIDLSLSKDIVGLGLKFFFIQICFLVLYQSSNIIITNIFSPNEVTPYNIAYKYMTMLPMIFVILVSPLWTAITDAYVKSDILWIKKTINKMFYVWLLCSFGAIIFVFISSPVIKIWIGEAVDIPKSYFIALSVFAIVDMWNKLFSSFSNGVARLKSQICATILEAVIFIPLAIVLAKLMGVVGVAWALAFVSIIPAIFMSIDYLLFLKDFNNAK